MDRTNKLTPRFEEPVKLSKPYDYISIDIGLWPGKAGHNSMNLMPYYQGGGRWYPIAIDKNGLQPLDKKCRELWQKYACVQCDGKGCKECENIGWKNYKKWVEKGKKKTNDNYPIL